MRGEIISVDGLSGDGLITGQDGVRYAFAASSARAIVRAGDQVDFVGTDGVATHVVAASTPGPNDGTPDPVISPATGEYDAMFALFQVQGRLRRSHFWISWSILFAIGFIVGLVPGISAIGYGLIYPQTAVQVKRLHDMGLTGWCVLAPYAVNATLLAVLIMGAGGGVSLTALTIVFVVANAGWLLLIGMTDSQRGRNAHGLNPKSRIDVTAETFA
jgi:uncharacterized membrane protein YhaH (DUF805 family)